MWGCARAGKKAVWAGPGKILEIGLYLRAQDSLLSTFFLFLPRAFTNYGQPEEKAPTQDEQAQAPETGQGSPA